MYQYQTKNKKYVFWTEEPLTIIEKRELEENQDLVIQLMRKFGAKGIKLNESNK